MTVRLRYTGVQAVTFREPGVGWTEPYGEFEVPESRLVSFMRRADIEHAGECPSPPCRCGEEPKPEPAPEPVASEDASRSHDGEVSGGSPSGRRGRSGSSKGTGEVSEAGVPQ